MKNLKDIILEKLQLNKNIKFSDYYQDKDFLPYRIKKPSGKEYMWYQFWKYLIDNGPTTKKDLLKNLGLENKSSSGYIYLFKELESHNVIISKGNKLEAQDPKEWKKE